MRPFLPRLALLSLSLGLSHAPAWSMDVRTVYAPDGQALFELRFHEPDERPSPDWSSSWALSGTQRDRVTEVMERWAHIVRPIPDGRTGIINIYTVDEPTAYAYSPAVESNGEILTSLQAALLGRGTSPALRGDADAEIVFGTFHLDDGRAGPSQHAAPTTGFGIEGIAFHELAHGMGIASGVEVQADEQGNPVFSKPYFFDADHVWNRHLRDDLGRPALPGQDILCADCTNEYHPDAFDVRQDRGYFAGPNVADALAGALPGVPVRMLYPNGKLDGNFMSHLELKNSLMSHQYFRSYTTFMEAELAVLQDLGYDIDRRRLFGHSVYGSGLTIENHQGFHARNAEGTAYLPGTYSTATLGMGLHVYGDRNRITQRADLLTQGPGAVGIRIDGEGNQLAIPTGVRVHGQGSNGAGVLFAYGRHHSLVHAGDIQAQGSAGVGILADFGNNSYSNERMVRGSYLYCDGVDQPCQAPWQSNRPLLPELDGALVSRLDISGAVAGRQAAIEASANALIGSIDILRGARIEGDIRSAYTQVDEHGRLRLTHLTLGRVADADGRAVEASDPQFRLDYAHDIVGDNLSLRLAGGEAALHGQNRVHDVRIDPGATLSGEASFQIRGAGQALVNHGRLAPGASVGQMQVDGDYRQGANGTLEIAFDGSGQHSRLAVGGTATLAGDVAWQARPDWYAPGWRLDLGNALQAGSRVGDFDRTTVALDSPTLQAHLEPAGAASAGPSSTLRISRASDAYARHGATAASASAGAALDRAVANATIEQQTLYQALDFSAPDGSGITAFTTQMAPTPYVAMAASQFDALRVVGDGLAWQQTQAARAAAGGEWQGIAMPFAGDSRRELDDGSRFGHRSQGLLLGTERSLQNSAWTVGIHAAFSKQRMTLRDSLQGDGRTSTWFAGLHARYVPTAGQGVFVQGQLRLASLSSRLNRDIDAAGYQASHSAHWRSHGVHAQATTGYQWRWTDTVSGGPVASLDYLWMRQPGFQEDGDPATQLSVQSARPQSLRASLGLRMAWNLAGANPGGGPAGTAAEQRQDIHLQFTRDQELMRHHLDQSATLSAQPGIGLRANQAVAGSGAWRLQLGLSHQTPRLTLAAYLEGQAAAQGQHQIAGYVSAGWRF